MLAGRRRPVLDEPLRRAGDLRSARLIDVTVHLELDVGRGGEPWLQWAPLLGPA